MILKYHGLLLDGPESGSLRLGIDHLIGHCQSWVWTAWEPLPPDVDIPHLEAHLARFGTNAYWQIAHKCRDTLWKIHTAIGYIGRYLDILEREEDYVYQGASMELFGTHARAHSEMSYHLDSLLSYLLILADCIAVAIPFFYYEPKVHIKTRSFRTQRSWYTETQPDFDPEYAALLRKRTDWFDALAGKNRTGLRNRVVHALATYQLGTAIYPNGQRVVHIEQVTADGHTEHTFLLSLSKVLSGLFYYLDGTYELFEARMIGELKPFVGQEWQAPLLSGSWEDRSRFLQFVETPDLARHYRLYPLLGEELPP